MQAVDEKQEIKLNWILIFIEYDNKCVKNNVVMRTESKASLRKHVQTVMQNALIFNTVKFHLQSQTVSKKHIQISKIQSQFTSYKLMS